MAYSHDLDSHLQSPREEDVDGRGRTQQGNFPNANTTSILDPALDQEITDNTSHPAVNTLNRLPSFIRQLPSNLGPRDLDYLADKDALTIPDKDFRDELLRHYASIVHPFMPALDLEDFLTRIIHDDGRNPVSLLLFQAVMFASVTFVDAKLLQLRGYSSRKAARKIFFNRVRLLYGLDCERDHMALLQALLLMTYWYDRPEDEKDTWHWMGIALSLAQVTGFHRNPEGLRITAHEKHLRRRIWWSCVMRDRLLALGIRRPSRVRDEDFDVPQLKLDDFDISTTPSEDVVRLMGDSGLTAPNGEARTVVAIMCIELSRLCVCIGHILHSQYTILGQNRVGFNVSPKAIVDSEASDRQSQELAKCDTELATWVYEQDGRSKYKEGCHMPTPRGFASKSIIHLHQALLQMNYLTALSALHRPQLVSPDSERCRSRIHSRKRVTETAIAMTKLAFDLQANKQLRHLSTSSIPAFLSAALIHLLDIRSSEEEVRNMSIGRFYQCLQALHQLQDMYASADYAIRYLDNVLRITNIDVPMLNMGLTQGSSAGLPKCQCHTSNSGVQSSIGTTYLSPPSSRNEPVIDGSTRRADLFQPDVTNSFTPLLNTFEPWPSDAAALDSNQGPTDLLAMSPYTNMWSDADNLIPELLGFNVENNTLLSRDRV